MMKLTIVGCSGSLSGPDSAASSYLVQAPYQDRTFSLLLDCGPGAMGALYRYLDPREVDAIALSHLHADHCLDLCGYYVAARYSPTAPWPRRPVYGPNQRCHADRRWRTRFHLATGASQRGWPICRRAFRLADLAAEPADRALYRPRLSASIIRLRRTPSVSRRMFPAAARWCTPATPAHLRPSWTGEQCRPAARGIGFSRPTGQS